MNWAQRMKAEREQLQREILQFRLHLLSSKFTGTERCCAHCGAHPTHAGDTCLNCYGPIAEQSKDWISTADVLRWLDGIESVLR